MSLTQKRMIQLPLLFILIFFVLLPLEWTILSQLPFYLGPVNLLTIVATYIALTRTLPQTLFWGIILGLIIALSYPFGFGAIVAAYAWSSLAAKLMTYALPFDSRIPFATLVCLQAATAKILWRLFTLRPYSGVSWFDFTFQNLPALVTLGILAFIALPFLVLWDDFFENNSAGTTDLSSSIAGMKR